MDMEVLVKNNIENNPMHYGPYVLGEISAPDSHYIPQLYSDRQATIDHRELNNDIFESAKKEKPIDEKKTPAAVFVVLGTTALLTAWALLKKAIFKK